MRARSNGVGSLFRIIGTAFAKPIESVCIAVPCAATHVSHELPLLMRSIALQTHTADHMVVAFNGLQCDAGVTTSLSAHSTSRVPVFSDHRLPPIEYLCNGRSGWQTATNRNLALDACLRRGHSFVAFIDCDDLMVPTRIEQGVRLASEYNASMVLHGYLRVPQHRLEKILQVWEASARRPHERYGERVIITPPSFFASLKGKDGKEMDAHIPRLHYGHSMVRVDGYAKMQAFNNTLRGSEDKDFVQTALRLSAVRAVHTSEDLSVYCSSSSTG